MDNKEQKLKIRFFGGVGEIGKNMTALEYGKDIIIIDAGMTFPSDDMPGIDIVIPDATYLLQNKEKVRGIVITHGHEDHIGGLPYLLKDLNVPVYGTKLSLALAESKLKENQLDANLNCVAPKSVIKLGCFTVEFIHMTHSIAGSVALAITTPVGVIFHTGDFKVDLTPMNNELMDLTRISEIGKRGVLLLMCDSTNVERAGYTMSENVVGATLDGLFLDNSKRRLIISTFASNVYRVQQIINLAYKHKRKVALSGRSMEKVVDCASRVGELTIPDNTLIELDKIKNYADKDLCIISTGSQGEPMSALTRMAAGESSMVKIGPNDTVIISASPIPGNEKMVYSVINNLYRKGAEVKYSSLEKIHVSGHACQEELKIIHSLIKPRFFIPVHGEYRHLKKHLTLAREMGMKEGNMLIAEIGNTVEFTRKTMRFGESFQAGSRYIDGLNIDDTQTTIRDRKHLAEDGVIVIVSCISAESGELVQGPDVITKGVMFSQQQLDDIKQIAQKTLLTYDVKTIDDKSEFRSTIRRSIKKYLFKHTKSNPMILPVITEV